MTKYHIYFSNKFQYFFPFTRSIYTFFFKKFTPIGSYLQDTDLGLQQAFSTSTNANELSNQQSRRESLLESQQGRISNQNIIGRSATEIVGSGPIEFQARNKYMQDSLETEKYQSNLASPTIRSSVADRRGSLRFHDELSNFADKVTNRDEMSPTLPQNALMYTKNEFKFNDSPQEYDQTNQVEIQSQKPFYDTQLDYRDQPHTAYDIEQYNDPQYNVQQNYDGIQYGAGVQQPTSEYEYQPEYQEYDAQQQIYQPNNLPPEPLQPEQQYEAEIYQERAPTHDIKSVQQYQNYSETNSGTSNIGQKNGNGNIINKQPNISKQSTTKKFT